MDKIRIKSMERCSSECPYLVITGICKKYHQILSKDSSDYYRCSECKKREVNDGFELAYCKV